MSANINPLIVKTFMGHVESGEGIERTSLDLSYPPPCCRVESGEGIESLCADNDELNGAVVESGEGIESPSANP